MDIGKAVELLKGGKKVARLGWNGKNMFLWLKPEFKIQSDWCKDPILLDICEKNGGSIIGLPSVSMKTVDNSVVPWLASQTDLLAEDWVEHKE